MGYYRKVVWKEGMFVTPHHFQQSEGYQDEILHYKLKSAFPFGWGVLRFDLNRNALANGNITITQLQLIMPDGTAISVPEPDNVPSSRNFRDFFAPELKALDVYIALPLEKDDTVNYLTQYESQTSDQRYARYVVEDIEVPNMITGKIEDKKKISIGKKNTKILLTGEELDNFTVVKVAEIARTPTGEFYLNDHYIPPCVHIAASVYLMDLLKGLIGSLSVKSEALSAQRSHKSAGAAKFGFAEATHFWLLHTVNSYIPLFLHYHNHPLFHPERLYSAMIQLIGALTTFAFEGQSSDTDPAEIVVYNHERLGSVFHELDRRIRKLLEVVIPTKWIQIPLVKEKDTLWVGRLESVHLEETKHFYLKAEGELEEKVIREELPEKIKISDKDNIETMVNRSLPGIPVIYTPTPADSIPIKPGMQYFKIEHNHRRWKTITLSRTIAVYLPIEFKTVKLEIIAVKE